ncbi:MAG: AAA family ATPase [Bacteroidales bacterium]|nr:AAA family ATPase [Bacteroidales bacterium]
MANIVGRKTEIEELVSLYHSKKAEFVAIYGRRRIGKTYLIKELFKDKMAFYHTGMSPIDTAKANILQDQLKSFHNSLIRYGMEDEKQPESWIEAFFMLEKLLESKERKERLVVFIDELPWMDSPRSCFLSAFEHFWNNWGSNNDKLMLIVCGSAASWVENKLINNHGGLYGRLTYEIKMSPFNLHECEEFFKSTNIKLNRYDIIQAYMAVGGIPYYLGFFRKGLSLGQNIDQLFFAKNAKLKKEFDRLFASLFSKPTYYKKIINLLSTKHCGFTRDEIAKATGIQKGGGFSKMLASLEASDFIIRYVPFGRSKREEHYKLTDNFCLFYSKFLANNKNTDTNYWEKNQNSQKISAWKGIAFEEVCLAHIQQIKNDLGIGAITSRESAWSLRGDDDSEGTQIDLLIDRDDRVVNLCEMKFYKDDFTINKAYDSKLRHRTQTLIDKLPKKRNVHLTFITSYGLTNNEYSGQIQKLVTMDALFEK